jgi:hypothetical protein
MISKMPLVLLSPGPWKDNSQWPQLSCLENGSAERKHGYGDGSVVAESFNSFRRLILRNHKQWYYYQTNHINTKPFSNKQNYRNHYNPYSYPLISHMPGCVFCFSVFIIGCQIMFRSCSNRIALMVPVFCLLIKSQFTSVRFPKL